MPEIRNIPTQPPIASVVTYTIKVEGQPIPRQYTIKAIVTNRQVNKIPKLTLSVFDGSAAQGNFSISNENVFVPGKKIEIHVGYQSQETLIFAGIIIKHSIKIGGKETLLQVEAADEIFKLTLNPKRKIFTDITDSDVMEAIAAFYPIQTDITATSVRYGELMQYYATDWDYIQTRAESAGMICLCENGTLVIKPPALNDIPVLQLIYGATIKELSAEIDARYQYAGGDGLGWNSTDQELIKVAAEAPSYTEQGNISTETLSSVAQSDPFVLIHGGNRSEEELQNRINTQLLKSRLAKIRGTVKTFGYADIVPGNMIELKGIGERFNGNTFVSAVRHEINSGIWETSIQFGISPEWFARENDIQPLSAAGFTPAVKGLQIGIVTTLENDPEGNNRIKVKIPVVDNDGDGTWCKISMPDAGDNRGFFFMPEIGDEVVIGFLNEDPDNGIVLGGLYSSAKPAPLTATDNNHEKGLVTRSKMKWIWNDEKKSLQIETPAGNQILVSDDSSEINLQDQHGNKILMNSSGITIESAKEIQLKAATNIKINADIDTELKSGATLKAEGTASAELKSSGTTTIKGSMVMIN